MAFLNDNYLNLKADCCDLIVSCAGSTTRPIAQLR